MSRQSAGGQVTAKRLRNKPLPTIIKTQIVAKTVLVSSKFLMESK
jgi:hypothetical protein